MTKGSDDLPEPTKTILKIIQEGTKKTESMPSPCIFRVPEELRNVKKSAYTPQLVSIGPLHSNKEHLKSPMEDIKKHYADVLFKRLKEANKTTNIKLVLQECVEKMERSLDKARDCYAEKVEVDAPEDVEKLKEPLDKAKECKWFAKKVDALDVTMLVIDGCFILELLYRYHKKYKSPKNHIETSNKRRQDFCFDSAQTRVAIRHDLLLLENQLPFFILEELFELTVATIPNPEEATIPNPPTIPKHPLSLSDYLLSYFDNMMNPSEQGNKDDRVPKSCETVSHILHFLHNQYAQQDSPKTDDNNYDSMPPASELEYAGVKFESTKTGDMVQFAPPHGFFWFCHRASFKIPTLRLSAATETLLRNLIAFEQCYAGHDCLHFYFTSYATLMDRLIDTENDVKVLQNKGVISSCLGDREEASDLINSLCKEIVLPRDKFNFAQPCNQAAKYSKLHWPKSLAYLRRTYFPYPWTFMAVLVAFIAFGMSVTQFIRSFLR